MKNPSFFYKWKKKNGWKSGKMHKIHHDTKWSLNGANHILLTRNICDKLKTNKQNKKPLVSFIIALKPKKDIICRKDYYIIHMATYTTNYPIVIWQNL